ncbi:guanylate kinase [Paludibacteraceae bacterium OttesenSCG-928-F17]|nr:guanylate kinase [Paludibacteraceae bacterium OttesenSCG-928-F17]
MAGKLIIFSAPSGAGKSTLVRHLLQKDFNLEFSISATSRKPRGTEVHGKEYYFLSADEFREKISKSEFVEYEEVYADCFYGTLKNEVDRIISQDKNVIFDVDVVGGLNIKKQYGNSALAVFIAPPTVKALEKRLNSRGTDSPEMIEQRINKAEYEMSFAPQFDKIIVNDDLKEAQDELEKVLTEFLHK